MDCSTAETDTEAVAGPSSIEEAHIEEDSEEPLDHDGPLSSAQGTSGAETTMDSEDGESDIESDDSFSKCELEDLHHPHVVQDMSKIETTAEFIDDDLEASFAPQDSQIGDIQLPVIDSVVGNVSLTAHNGSDEESSSEFHPSSSKLGAILRNLTEPSSSHTSDATQALSMQPNSADESTALSVELQANSSLPRVFMCGDILPLHTEDSLKDEVIWADDSMQQNPELANEETVLDESSVLDDSSATITQDVGPSCEESPQAEKHRVSFASEDLELTPTSSIASSPRKRITSILKKQQSSPFSPLSSEHVLPANIDYKAANVSLNTSNVKRKVKRKPSTKLPMIGYDEISGPLPHRVEEHRNETEDAVTKSSSSKRSGRRKRSRTEMSARSEKNAKRKTAGSKPSRIDAVSAQDCEEIELSPPVSKKQKKHSSRETDANQSKADFYSPSHVTVIDLSSSTHALAPKQETEQEEQAAPSQSLSKKKRKGVLV